MVDLLPCPFCGSDKPFIQTNYHGQSQTEGWRVVCGACDAMGGEITLWNGKKIDAINKWNNRKGE